MNLFILRHASAGLRRKSPLLDLKRPLDKDGKRHCLHLAHVLNALKIQFDLVVSSPLKRSLQTASLVGTETGYESQILLSNGLAPDATFEDFQKLLPSAAATKTSSSSATTPTSPTSLARCSCPPSDPMPAAVRLRKGTIARLNLHSRPRHAPWHARPPHRPRPLRHLDKELPPKDLAEVARLFLQRPRLQLRSTTSRTISSTTRFG